MTHMKELKKHLQSTVEKTEGSEEIAKMTYSKALDYYRAGNLYKYATDGREYVLNMFEKHDGMAYFESLDGFEIHIPWNMLGTLLPGIADTGKELIKID